MWKATGIRRAVARVRPMPDVIIEAPSSEVLHIVLEHINHDWMMGVTPEQVVCVSFADVAWDVRLGGYIADGVVE